MLELASGVLIGAALAWAVKEWPGSWRRIWRPAAHWFRFAVLLVALGIVNAIGANWATALTFAALVIILAGWDLSARLRRSSRV
jgi:hypothetical protein